MPKSSTPALLEMMVRSFDPLRRTAAIRFSGMPQRPKPPIRMVAPSRSPAMAVSALATRLSMVSPLANSSAGLKPALHAARTRQRLIDLVGRSELSFQFAAGEPRAQIIYGLG